MALVEVNPAAVFPVLLKTMGDAELSTETRLKMGEAVLKTVSILDQLLPHYFAMLVPHILHGCRESDAYLRSSALAILAEIARNPGFVFAPFLEQTLHGCTTIVNSAKDAESRRGAVHVLAGVMQGLTGNTKETLVFIGPHLSPLRELFCQVESRDPDDVTRFHAKVSLITIHNSLLIATPNFCYHSPF